VTAGDESVTKQRRSSQGRLTPLDVRIERLRECIDTYAGRYRQLRGVKSFEAYVTSREPVADEETLTEPLLADIIEKVLGFPKDAYFPQLGKSGLKPDFTPIDLVAHRFVLVRAPSSPSRTRSRLPVRSPATRMRALLTARSSSTSWRAVPAGCREGRTASTSTTCCRATFVPNGRGP
jgi:hypothetical protein